MMILDTDILTLIQHGKGEAYQRIIPRLETTPVGEVFVTIVSFEEQTRGWLTQIAKAKTMDEQVVAYDRLFRLLDDYCKRQVLRFDMRAASEYQDLRNARLRIGTMDLRIAAIARSRGARVISRNLSDFSKVPGLHVQDWTQPS